MTATATPGIVDHLGNRLSIPTTRCAHCGVLIFWSFRRQAWEHHDKIPNRTYPNNRDWVECDFTVDRP